MDIFEQARKMNADYYDYITGYVYKIQEYNRLKSFGLDLKRIRVIDMDGSEIGFVYEEG